MLVMERTNQNPRVRWEILLAYLASVGFCLGAWTLAAVFFEKVLAGG